MLRIIIMHILVFWNDLVEWASSTSVRDSHHPLSFIFLSLYFPLKLNLPLVSVCSSPCLHISLFPAECLWLCHCALWFVCSPSAQQPLLLLKLMRPWLFQQSDIWVSVHCAGGFFVCSFFILTQLKLSRLGFIASSSLFSKMSFVFSFVVSSTRVCSD